MSETKEKVHLVAEQETLMITLFAKTLGSPPGWYLTPLVLSPHAMSIVIRP